MTRPWADQPYTLIPTPTKTPDVSPQTYKVAAEMALAHNILLRLLNSVYLQCTHVTTPTDIQDFLIYTQACHTGITHHHHCEERVFFPAIEKYTGVKGIMDGNVAQHAAFEPELEKLRKYVWETKVADYDGKVVRSILDEAVGALRTHLEEEIGSLLALEKYGGKNLEKAFAELEVEIQKNIEDKYRNAPVGLGGIDRTFEGGKWKAWPPMPWFVPYLVYFVYFGKFKGSWRFSPCTLWMKPRELEFVEEK